MGAPNVSSSLSCVVLLLQKENELAPLKAEIAMMDADIRYNALPSFWTGLLVLWPSVGGPAASRGWTGASEEQPAGAQYDAQ